MGCKFFLLNIFIKHTNFYMNIACKSNAPQGASLPESVVCRGPGIVYKNHLQANSLVVHLRCNSLGQKSFRNTCNIHSGGQYKICSFTFIMRKWSIIMRKNAGNLKGKLTFLSQASSSSSKNAKPFCTWLHTTDRIISKTTISM